MYLKLTDKQLLKMIKQLIDMPFLKFQKSSILSVLSGSMHRLNLAGQGAPLVGNTANECMIIITER